MICERIIMDSLYNPYDIYCRMAVIIPYWNSKIPPSTLAPSQNEAQIRLKLQLISTLLWDWVVSKGPMIKGF